MRAQLRRILHAKSAGSAIVLTMLTNIAVQGANVASGVLTARSLGPAGRGALASIIMWPQFLAYAMTLGIPVASVYCIKRRPDLASELSGAALFLSATFGLLSAFVGMWLIPVSLHQYPAEVIHVAELWALITPLELFSTSVMSLVQVTGSFKYFNAVRICVPLSIVLALSLESITGTLSVDRAAAAYLVAGLPVTFWITVWIWKYFRPTLKLLSISSKQLLGYGVRAWGADLLATVAGQIDRILVVGLLSPEVMGIYVVAQSAAALLGVLPNAVAPVALPKSSGLPNEAIVAIVGRAARATLFVMVVAAVGLMVFGGLLLRLVYGSHFAAAGTVLPYLIVEAVLGGLTAVLSQALLASAFPGTVSLLQGVGLLVSVPFLYVLIHRFGLQGAGMALVIATSFRLVFVVLSFRFCLKLPAPDLIITKTELDFMFSRFRPKSLQGVK